MPEAAFISPRFEQVLQRNSGVSPRMEPMANHKSAEKRVRQTKRRTANNNARRSRVRTSLKKIETAIAAGDQAAARAALKEAQPQIMSGAAKGALHKNTAARKISRLSARIKALAAK